MRSNMEMCWGLCRDDLPPSLLSTTTPCTPLHTRVQLHTDRAALSTPQFAFSIFSQGVCEFSHRFLAYPPCQVPGVKSLSFQAGSAVSKFPAHMRFEGVLLSCSWELSPRPPRAGQHDGSLSPTSQGR